MTFALVVASQNSLWACADRQLSRGNPPPPDPSGVKIACVDAADGVAVITYSGVGRGNKRQVSEWIGRLLHGFGGTLDQTLVHIGEVAHDRLAPYARTFRKPHRFIAAAKRAGTHCLYNVDPLRPPPRVGLQPAAYPEQNLFLPDGYGKDLAVRSIKSLDRRIRQFDSGQISASRVARKLAALNRGVAAKYGPWVSPECVVCWRTMNPPRIDVLAFDVKGALCAAPRIPLIVTGIPLHELAEASRGFRNGGIDVGEDTANQDAMARVSEIFSRGPDKEL